MSIGLTEWLVITLVFLLLFGKNLAKIGQELGRFTQHLRAGAAGKTDGKGGDDAGSAARQTAELFLKARKFMRSARSPFSIL